MAPPKRPPWKPTAQWMDVYTRYTQHRLTQPQAADILGVHRNTVWRNFRRMELELFEAMSDHVAQVKVGQTNTIRHVIEQAQAAFDKSMCDREVVHERETSGKVYREKTLLVGGGNAQFLTVILKGLEDIRRIWGANAPEQVEVEAKVSREDENTATRLESIRKRMKALVPEVHAEVIEAQATAIEVRHE